MNLNPLHLYHAINIRRHRWRAIRRARRQIFEAKEVNLIIGAGGTTFENWISTDVNFLDVRSVGDWQRLVKPNSVHRLLAEHVFEHLSVEDCSIAFRNCHAFLHPDGRFRIAVPDGNRPDQTYLAHVSPPADDHLCLFTRESLTALLEESGFTVRPLEYFDAVGQFHAAPWQIEDGYVGRSSRFDRQPQFRNGNVYYTSLILDAFKAR